MLTWKDFEENRTAREYIIHPVETLQEILQNIEMFIQELSVRTGVDDFIMVISGRAPFLKHLP